jgi:hypothetical protein
MRSLFSEPATVTSVADVTRPVVVDADSGELVVTRAAGVAALVRGITPTGACVGGALTSINSSHAQPLLKAGGEPGVDIDAATVLVRGMSFAQILPAETLASVVASAHGQDDPEAALLRGLCTASVERMVLTPWWDDELVALTHRTYSRLVRGSAPPRLATTLPDGFVDNVPGGSHRLVYLPVAYPGTKPVGSSPLRIVARLSCAVTDEMLWDALCRASMYLVAHARAIEPGQEVAEPRHVQPRARHGRRRLRQGKGGAEQRRGRVGVVVAVGRRRVRRLRG